MDKKNYYPYLDLSEYFFDNINRRKQQDDNQTKLFNYENQNINPPFRYYKDDTNLNFNRQFIPSIRYKQKSLFPAEKPSQTEHDEIGINMSYLNKYYGYTNYGNFKVANQSLPEENRHKKTPKNKILELL